jgi:hypothetical protein
MSTPILSGSNNKIAVIRAGQSAKSDTFRADMLLNQKFSGVQRYVIPPPPPGYIFQGNNYGYSYGNGIPGGGPGTAFSEAIDRFDMASEDTSSVIGNLTEKTHEVAAFKSFTHGYRSSGQTVPVSNYDYTDTIDEFPFANPFVTATSVATASSARRLTVGISSEDNGYIAGGTNETPGLNRTSNIDKFSYSSKTPATVMGALTLSGEGSASQQSSTDGYVSGGFPNPGQAGTPLANQLPGRHGNIDKFSFASDGNAVLIGELEWKRYTGIGHSSAVNGYIAGGFNTWPSPNAPNITDRIEKFPFFSDANSVLVGNLSQSKQFAAGQSSETKGYTTGGNNTQFTNKDNALQIVEYYAFSSENTSVVANGLSAKLFGNSGTQS